MAGRGHYKIFLGMAAGVGKTYRMLQEGQAEAEAGRDVVIGYLEPHDRPDTIAQAHGLEALPRRRVAYRGNRIEEMDLPAILRRAPELCLIDELAHTNVAGLEYAKRYEDIGEVLRAGIDVFSTVNVQHLESLNDTVAELTGTRVRETFPDAVLRAADEVVLVDVTPQSLIDRLRDGKVYPLDRVPAALDNFFRVENLSALREVALRQVAEEVELGRVSATRPARAGDERLIDSAAPQAIRERLLALITPEPASQRIIRRAWRSAQRLGAELDILWVADHPASPAELEQIEAMRRLASVLGAHLLVESGDDVAASTARVAAERGTTFVLIGPPRRPRSALRRLLRPALVFQLLALLPGVDVRIVADRSQLTTRRPS